MGRIEVLQFKQLIGTVLADSIEINLLPHSHIHKEKVQNNRIKIEEIWERESQKRGENLFNGSILALHDIWFAEGVLKLTCHKMDYKNYLAQLNGIDLKITLLAVSGLTYFRTKTGNLMFYVGKRSASMTQYPGYYEFVPSGSLDYHSVATSGNLGLKKQALLELREELGISEKSVLRCQEFCLIADRQDSVIDVGFEIEIENFNREMPSVDSLEYSVFETVEWNFLPDYMEQHQFVPTSIDLYKCWTKKF